jgi:hypothetical protein
VRVDSTTRRKWTTAQFVFSVMLLLCTGFVIPATAQSISGHVFEDQGYAGGSGRNYATALSNGIVATARTWTYQSCG